MAKLVTPEAVYLGGNLFQATLGKNPKPTDKPKFWVRYGFTAENFNSPLIVAIREDIIRCARDAWGAKVADAMLASPDEYNFRSPFRKDGKAKGYPDYVYRWIGSSGLEYSPPGLFSRFVGKDGKLDVITDKREFYPGALIQVSIATRAYGKPGGDQSPGISIDLRGVMKKADGVRLAIGGDTEDGESFGPGEKRDEAAEGSALAGMLD